MSAPTARAPQGPGGLAAAGPVPAEALHGSTAPSPWVQRWARLLSPGVQVLDLACGHGRHAQWLASLGHRVTAVDRDAAALAELRRRAPAVEAVEADLEAGPWPLGDRRFDAVVVTHYLWRPLWPPLREAVSPGGLLVYETFNVDQAAVGRPTNPQFLLEHGELLQCVAGWRVVAYEDGWLEAPGRHVQRVVAVRPSADAAGALSAAPARHPL